ncbi:hypothetical protein GCM10011418_25330 [Sphingobacterium alkalisoli]|nr:hypothetical protein GCM10011418_25330 [Sphingobacterium alkalisoli]
MLFSEAQAQSVETRTVDGLNKIEPLQIGDTIPEALWNMTLKLTYFDGNNEDILFRDLKGKLILLDFWSTSCKGCLEGMPKMELIQSKFKEDVYVLLVNSKRNKDTPQRIKNTFAVYKEVNNYTPSLPTLLDDTVFTQLLPHNTIPTIGWISKNGVFLSNSFSGQVTNKNILEVLESGKVDLPEKGIIQNLDRLSASPLIDTMGHTFISAFSGRRKDYLAVFPNVLYNNGNSIFQIGNYGWSFMLSYAFQAEMKGFSWNDYVFDPALPSKVKFKILKAGDTENLLWYQLYIADSIALPQAAQIFRQDFERNFGVSVDRRMDSIDVYEIELSDKIDRIRTTGGMRINRIQSLEDEILYQNVSLRLFIRNLFYLIDRPTVFGENESIHIDIQLPSGFADLTIQEKRHYLAERGINLVPRKVFREYPYIYKSH